MALNDTALPEVARPELPPHLRKPRLRRWEASQYLRHAHGIDVAHATLAKYASVGGGPTFQKAGRVPLYPREALDAWAQDRLGRLQRSTSDIDRGPSA